MIKFSFWDRVILGTRKRHLDYWTKRYIEARGKMVDIELGKEGAGWKTAKVEADRSKEHVDYYQEKIREMESGEWHKKFEER